MCVILLVSCCIPVSATTLSNYSLSLETQIVNHSKLVCQAYGTSLTSDEENELRLGIREIATTYAKDNSCTLNSAYNAILSEMLIETPLESISVDIGMNVRSSSGNGTVQLPSATAGYIFFTDNDKPYNHVGMYTSSDTIIEAMPDPGVHEVSVTDSTALQECTGDSHDQSCILSVDGANANDISSAITWTRNYIGCDYDNSFLSNKKNTTSQNEEFNCSELVWKAYRFGAPSNLDLDSNGGFAVYPNNIYNSDLTIHQTDF